MSVTKQVITTLLSLTGTRRVFTYPGSPPRYVYEAVIKSNAELVTAVREQHLLHLAQAEYFQTLEQGTEQIPVVVVSADLGEAMASQGLLAGSITSPCIIVVAEESFPHVENAVNIAHQTDRATTHQSLDDTEPLQRHENVATRAHITDEDDLTTVGDVVETVRTQQEIGIIHLPLYADTDEPTAASILSDYTPDQVSLTELENRWMAADRPLLIVGRGIRDPTVRDRIADIAETGGVPITTTLQMDGYFDTNHVGRIGTVGTPSANEAFNQADLVVALGSSVNNLITSYDPAVIQEFQSKTIQVDVNPRRRSVFTDSWIPERSNTVVDRLDGREAALWTDTQYNQNGKMERVPDPVQGVAAAIRDHCPETVVTLGVGNAMIWMTYALGPTIRKEVARTGSMGEVVAGLHWGDPPILVLGDGEFEMDLSLLTEAQHQGTTPVICVVNNERLGLVTERQEAEFGERLTEKYPAPINYEELGRAFADVESFSTTTAGEAREAVSQAVRSDVVSVIEVRVEDRLSADIFDISTLPRTA